MDNIESLIRELIQLPHETEWVEFKHNNYNPEMIGKDISALANSAALHEKEHAYMLWGIDDTTHEIIGTKEDLQTVKVGSQELENWLRSLLSDHAEFKFESCAIDDKRIGILVIRKAILLPIVFKDDAYIRVGSYTRPLSKIPSLQGPLWDKLRSEQFEDHLAVQHLTLRDALNYLAYPAYFDIKKIPLPDSLEGIAHYMIQEGIMTQQDDGHYAITNRGALLFAKDLSDFEPLIRKAIRVIQYNGKGRHLIERQTTFEKGYALSFPASVAQIEALIPTHEDITSVFREKSTAYPLPVIRETIANALIHQDFSLTGTGLTVELFDDRIEVTNPGTPLVDILRIIDNPPRSRNEKLAALMRRLSMCEELGSGWDRMVILCELSQLPAPKIEAFSDHTRVTLYRHKDFTDLSSEERLWACYLHACIKHVQEEYLTNRSLRERFGLPDSSAAIISRLIKEAVSKNIIKPFDPDTAPRYMKYMPIWA